MIVRLYSSLSSAGLPNITIHPEHLVGRGGRFARWQLTPCNIGNQPPSTSCHYDFSRLGFRKMQERNIWFRLILAFLQILYRSFGSARSVECSWIFLNLDFPRIRNSEFVRKVCRETLGKNWVKLFLVKKRPVGAIEYEGCQSLWLAHLSNMEQ